MPSPTAAQERPVPTDRPEPSAVSPVVPADVKAMFLTREALGARPIRTVDVAIPEEFGGGRVRLRALKQGERERLDDETMEKTYDEQNNVKVKIDYRGFQAKALAMCMINPDGSPYFATVEEGQAFVANLDDKLFDILFEPCDKLNILTGNARRELGKDSAPSPSSSSSSTLPTSGAASSKS